MHSEHDGKKLPAKLSIHTVIEVSKKINELLEQMEYDNKEMLLTKEHIRHNLIKLINYANYHDSSVENKTEIRNPEYYKKFSHNYFVDNRGVLITNYIK